LRKSEKLGGGLIEEEADVEHHLVEGLGCRMSTREREREIERRERERRARDNRLRALRAGLGFGVYDELDLATVARSRKRDATGDGLVRVGILQGYLAHKKLLLPGTLQQAYA